MSSTPAAERLSACRFRLMVAHGSEKGAVRLAVVGPFRSETRFQKLLAAAPAVAASDIGATGSNADEVRPVGVCADGKMSWRRVATMAITDTHGERASSRLSPHTGTTERLSWRQTSAAACRRASLRARKPAVDLARVVELAGNRLQTRQQHQRPRSAAATAAGTRRSRPSQHESRSEPVLRIQTRRRHLACKRSRPWAN